MGILWLLVKDTRSSEIRGRYEEPTGRMINPRPPPLLFLHLVFLSLCKWNVRALMKARQKWRWNLFLVALWKMWIISSWIHTQHSYQNANLFFYCSAGKVSKRRHYFIPITVSCCHDLHHTIIIIFIIFVRWDEFLLLSGHLSHAEHLFLPSLELLLPRLYTIHPKLMHSVETLLLAHHYCQIIIKSNNTCTLL